MRRVISYDRDLNYATYKIIEKGKVYLGKAKIHPDDLIIATEYTGLTIAEFRARIKREKCKMNVAKKEMNKLKNKLNDMEKYYKERESRYIELTNVLEDYIKSKEDFRQKLIKYQKEDK